MSDLRSPVFMQVAKVQPFAAKPVGQLGTTVSTRRTHGTSVQEELELQKQLTLETAEKLGRERGHAKGFISGYEEGKEIGAREARNAAEKEFAAELVDFTQDLEKVSEDLQIKIEEWFRDSENRMTDLAMTAVRKVLCAELSISRESAVEIVKDALRDVTHSRHARIKVNPFDSPTLRDHKQEIMSAGANLRDVEFVSDSSISGGCLIETEGGVVDATTETKLFLIENQLKLAS